MASAVALDAIGTIFDMAPVHAAFRRAGAPPAALEAWFGRLLHSATSVTLARRFEPFDRLAASALRTTLAQLGVDPDAAGAILASLSEMEPYPEAGSAIGRLEEAGIPVLVVTNSGAKLIGSLLERAGLLTKTEGVLEAAEVGAYKPDPRIYLTAAERLGVPPSAVTLIAAHGWDVMGAESAGLGAIWIDRAERLWPFPFEAPVRAGDLEEAVALALGGGPAG